MWRRILRNFLDDSIVEHKSRPPLRWIANWAGSIASKNMLELSYMEDEGLDKGFRYKYILIVIFIILNYFAYLQQ